MFEFWRTEDREYIRESVTHSQIWKSVSDDYSIEREKWQPIMDNSLIYLGVKGGDTKLGIFMLTPQNGICYEVHTCLNPVAWGKSVQITREGLEWIWANTNIQRIVTSVPSYNSLALRLSLKAGMVQYGVNPASYQKQGKLHHLILLGISRGSTQCH